MIRFLLYSAAIGIIVATSGCGPSLMEVKGVVTLDGTPVEGAVVTFVSESGTDTFSGTTNDKGEFTLTSTDQKAGAKAGSYKVMVTKTSSKGEPMTPKDATAMGEMKDSAKGVTAKAGGPKAPVMSGKGSAPRMGPGAISELPLVYANADTSPLKGIKIPPDTQPIKLELKSK